MTATSSLKKPMFKINLTNIEGNGEFPCPKCGIVLSPDDESESLYLIVETNIGEDDSLESLVILCNECKSTIQLEGFEALEEEGPNVEFREIPLESKPGYRSCQVISVNGKQLGKLTVEYAQKEDVKAFKRMKKIHVGESFKGTIIFDNMNGFENKKPVFHTVIKAVKKKFRGLTNNDIFLVEIKDGQKKIIGKASML